MKKLEELDARYMNLLTDFGFHKVFGDEANKDLLMDFLNQVVKEEGLITDIKILPPEEWGNFKTDRKAVFDIFCTSESGEYFIVEMQKAKQVFFRDRSIFYAALPIQKQAPKGIWNFRLNKVYLVAILDFVLFDECEKDKEQMIERVYLTRESTKTIFSNKLELAFIELPKFRKTENELKTNFDNWLYLLKNMPKLKDRPVSVKGDIFKKLFELAEIKQLTKKDMGKYRKSVLDYHDVRDAMGCARDEGREEGIEIGIEKGIEKEKNAVIRKCLQKNMVMEDIVFLTGYSKDMITRLIEN